MTMETRAILAAILMAALLIIYQTFFVQAPPEAPEPAQKTAEAPQPKTPAATPEAPAARPAPTVKPGPVAPPPPLPRPPQRTVPVEGPLYRGVVSSEGGKLQEWTLRYRGDKPMVIVGDLGPGGLMVAPDAGAAGEVVPMTVAPDGLSLGRDRPSGDLVLTGDVDGLRVRETLRFGADAFFIDALIRVENVGSAPRTVTVTLPWSTRTAWNEIPEKFTGQHPTEVVWSADGHIQRVSNLLEVGDHARGGSWVGVGSVWYLGALVPKTPGFTLVTAVERHAAERKNGEKEPLGRVTVGVRATPTIAPGRAWEGHVVIFVGPKEYERLQAHGLEGTLDFGGFPVPRSWGLPTLPMEWLGVPILLLMKWVYRYVGNYGIAIILLTVISKILFFPLTVKSLRSMKAMQALGPQVNALRNKYKSDPQRLQRETMELYKANKVNPMGGCLPMVAQVPIFYALYLALSVSVELQNASFLCFGRFFGMDLWICDLASQDPTYVLPILMGVSMFVQQKMTPTTGDPRQAKMMLVMPFVFTFMFLNLPSGLVLYWSLSNVLQILQQWYMDRSKPRRAVREAKDA
ncbi:MAG: membrane protein insertase YidC [Candidatus Rokubacteria bacterium]|nr:membrane protein insertase YidC [Candidatus Rokubacteria bacterium]